MRTCRGTDRQPFHGANIGSKGSLSHECVRQIEGAALNELKALVLSRNAGLLNMVCVVPL